MAINRLVKGTVAGPAIGADETGRYLSPHQREALIAQLSADAEARAGQLLAEARAAAAAVLAGAERAAGDVRAAAHREGYSAGHAQGYAEGLAQAERIAVVLASAAEQAEAIRLALLDGVEAQAVALALDAARAVVGAAATDHEEVAAAVVRNGLRHLTGRVLRIRTHPDDIERVTVALLADGHSIPVAAGDAIEAGGCIIDVEGGTVDLRLPVQLESLERLLRHAA